MAEAVATLALASSILQVIDFGTKVASTASKVYQASQRNDDSLNELEAVYKNLSSTLDTLQKDSTATVDSETDGIKSLAKGCSELAKELVDTLRNLGVGKAKTKRKALWVALKHTWKDEEILALQARLNEFKSQLTLCLLVSVRQFAGQSLSKQEEILERLGQVGDGPIGASILDYVTSGLDASSQEQHRQFLERDLIETIRLQKSSPGGDVHALKIETTQEVYKKSIDLLLKSLEYAGMQDREDRVADAHEVTFQWIFERSSDKWVGFREWLESDNKLYWITGKAGSGKSTLMKYISHPYPLTYQQFPRCRSHEYLKRWAGNRNLIVASFYFSNSGLEIQTTYRGLLFTLLRQILEQCHDLLPLASPSRWENLCLFGLNPEWTDTELRSLLLQCIENLGRLNATVALFVDGLDEFGGDLNVLISMFEEIQKLPHQKLCVASRTLNEFRDAFAQNPSLMVEHLTHDDITNFVIARFKSDPMFAELKLRESDFADQLVEEIVSKSSGVFLWVSLVVTSLLVGMGNGDRIADFQQRLYQLPPDLYDLYRKMIRSLNPFYLEHTAQLFALVDASRKPMNLLLASYVDEENPKVALKMEQTPIADQEAHFRMDAMHRRINRRSSGLLEIKGGKSTPQGFVYNAAIHKKVTVQYLHRTVKDFIEKDREVQQVFAGALSSSFDPHLMLLAGHMAYMKKTNPDTISPRRADDYLVNWLFHSRAVQAQNVDTTMQLLENLTQMCPHVVDIAQSYFEAWRQGEFAQGIGAISTAPSTSPQRTSRWKLFNNMLKRREPSDQDVGRRSLEPRASNSVHQGPDIVRDPLESYLVSAVLSSGSDTDDDGEVSVFHRNAPLFDIQNDAVTEGHPDRFTDSGYASRALPHSSLEAPSGKNLMIDDDVEDTYSKTASLDDNHQYISEITDDLLKMFGHGLSDESSADVAKLLPRLLEAAAMKIGQDISDPRNLKVMYFVHKHRKRIVEEFEERLRSQTKGTANSIPLDEKMAIWRERTSPSPMHIKMTDEPQEDYDNPLWDSSREVDEFVMKSCSSPSSVVSDTDPSAPDAQIEASGTIVLDEYTKIWSTSHGRDWLRATLRQSLKLTVADDTEAYCEFQKVILESLTQGRHISSRTTPEPYVAQFNITWSPWDFHSNEGYSETLQEVLARAITLTASRKCQSLIEILQYAINHDANSVHTFSLLDGTNFAVQHCRNVFTILVKGTKFSIVEVGEQLGWISTALRSSSQDVGIAVFRPSIHRSGMVDRLQKDKQTALRADKCVGFAINSQQTGNIPPVSGVSGDCWMSLFRNPVLVQGFPVLKRDEPELGIEMPPGIMAKIMQASHITFFGEKFFIKGYSALAVAVHAEAMLELPDGLDVISKVDIMTCRHILGWCDDAANYTGTGKSSLDIKDSGRSIKRINTKPVVMDRIAFGFAPPQTPISLNFSCAVGRKEKPTHIPWGTVYEKRLQTLGRRRVLLYDIGDNIGWIVDGTSALLHLVRVQLKHDADAYSKIGLFQFDSRQLKEPSEDVAYTGHMASMFVLANRQNRDLPIGGALVEHWEETTKKTSKNEDSTPVEEVEVAQKTKEVPICFEQVVVDMCTKFELIFEHEAQRIANDGLSLPNPKGKKLQGYDFLDIYQCDGALHIQESHHYHRGARLVEALGALTLFGHGFGKLIQAAKADNACNGCFFEADVPRGQHLFVASGKELHAILHEDRDQQQGGCWDRMCKTHWDEARQCFGCSCKKVRKRETFRSIFLRSKARHSTQPHSSLRSERAAAIFSYDAVKWKDVIRAGPRAEQDHLHSAEQQSRESARSGLVVQSASSRSEPTHSTTDLADTTIHSTTTPIAISDESPPTSCDPPTSVSDQPDNRSAYDQQKQASQQTMIEHPVLIADLRSSGSDGK
ncbi:hypothetical protein E8E14_002109 [Neopestalotiopsis sp. 37M]|nr:hypothetical protein E8E14_002109 [Neopestalotiopsis sp. 37M]